MKHAQTLTAMGVSRFEDLRVWQAAKSFASDISGLLAKLAASRDFALSDQLNSAAVSTVASIAEGFMRRSRRDFARFVRIAAASNGEARSLLHVAGGRKYLEASEYERLIEATEGIGRMLAALHRSLQSAGQSPGASGTKNDGREGRTRN